MNTISDQTILVWRSKEASSNRGIIFLFRHLKVEEKLSIIGYLQPVMSYVYEYKYKTDNHIA